MWLRWGLTLLLLLAIAFFLDVGVIWRELARFSVPMLLAAMIISMLQVLVSAWRWRYTAGRLAISLPFWVAVREYYLATFLNQVLPGGVLGDVNRAWRHSLGSGARLGALHAVMIERLSGQVVMISVALGLGGWLATHRGRTADVVADLGGGAVAVAATVVILLAILARFWAGGKGYVYALRRDIRKSLLSWPAILIQVSSSAVVVVTYLGVFAVLALGAGYWAGLLELMILMTLASLLLLAMAVPVSVAGWGVREGAAALLWPLAGLPPEQGVALSVGYGLAVLISSLPGVVFIVSSRRTAG
ncbi:lysylphosphatidylglycerol synthase transmembrane domain-containing protein [Marinobacter sp. TBZ242]|uniref:Lysylphosphatidylglycerol synthase transmembrane domain-containing protein n=1 Tax=Marinobacter azerbaijanicus TaxID=3050455 RepID=A0ABT7I6K5_9GAMM|nr:lysylphosphatidylglycerol synthase transmembrane domain-containing protein [Marinobacter sp. TBZ242]MDL0429746.1 lysylphosphatidylglycerol synthase transmembrane domain-containing protein [Marinobacter sp. TBZ242]